MLQEKEKASTTNEFVINRVFNAPRKIVFKAFTEAESLAQWWGPKGFKITAAKLDFRPGGIFHYCIEADGVIMWAKFVFQEIIEPQKIVFILSFSDENGGVTRAPMLDNWPLETLNIVTLTEKDGKTFLILIGGPINATEQEITVYKDNFLGMTDGFTGAFDKLDEYLAKL